MAKYRVGDILREHHYSYKITGINYRAQSYTIRWLDHKIDEMNKSRTTWSWQMCDGDTFVGHKTDIEEFLQKMANG